MASLVLLLSVTLAKVVVVAEALVEGPGFDVEGAGAVSDTREPGRL